MTAFPFALQVGITLIRFKLKSFEPQQHLFFLRIVFDARSRHNSDDISIQNDNNVSGANIRQYYSLIRSNIAALEVDLSQAPNKIVYYS